MAIRHVVMFKFKDDIDDGTIKKVVQKFDELAESLNVVHAYERGEQNSKEGLDGGFTHIFLLDFADTAARDRYVVHEEHKKFVKETVQPSIEQIMVVDYPISFRAQK